MSGPGKELEVRMILRLEISGIGFTNMIYGEIYPLSVKQGYQRGEIIKIGSCDLIRHYCGFGFLYNRPNENELEDIFNIAQSMNRTILFTNDKEIIDYYKSKEIKTGTRYFFECTTVVLKG